MTFPSDDIRRAQEDIRQAEARISQDTQLIAEKHAFITEQQASQAYAKEQRDAQYADRVVMILLEQAQTQARNGNHELSSTLVDAMALARKQLKIDAPDITAIEEKDS